MPLFALLITKAATHWKW